MIRNNKILYFSLFLIILIGFFFRIINITDYHLDIAESNLLDRADLEKPGLLEDLKWAFSTILMKARIHGEPLANLFIRWTHRLFNNNVLAIRLYSVIFGTLTILLWFFLIKLLMRDNRLALFSTALLSFSFFHIFFSRSGWPHLAMSFWFLLYLFLVIYYLWYKQKFSLLLASIFVFIIGFLTVPTMIFAPLGVAVFGIFSAVFSARGLPWKNKLKLSNYLAILKKKPIRNFLLSLCVILLVASILFPAGAVFKDIEGQEANLGLIKGESFFQKFFSFITSHFHSFWDYQKQLWSNFRPGSFSEIIPIWLILFSQIGLLVLLFSKDKKKYFFLFQLFFFYFAIVYLRAWVKHSILVPFDYFFYFAGSIGILFCLKKLIKKPAVINLILVLFIILELAFAANSLFLNKFKYFKAAIIDYPAQKEKIGRVLDYFKDKEGALVMVDFVDHSPGYHLEDYGIPFEYISYDSLTSRIESGDPPQYYLSYEVFKRHSDTYKLIREYYNEELSGLYVKRSN